MLYQESHYDLPNLLWRRKRTTRSLGFLQVLPVPFCQYVIVVPSMFVAEEVDNCLELCCGPNHSVPRVPARRVVPGKVPPAAQFSKIGQALRAPLYVDYNIV